MHSKISKHLCWLALGLGTAFSSASNSLARASASTVEGFAKIRTLEPLKGLFIEHYVHEKSGLNVYLSPNKDSDALAYVTSYGVGSRNETQGRTGMAHLFEHMMFRGTPSFPVPFQTLSNWGDSFNAYTSFDLTLYHELVPSMLMEEVAKFESERMRLLKITPEGYATERRAVISERQMSIVDKPMGRLFWELHQLAFDTHPYKTTAIGWQKDLDAATIEDALAFYKRYYAPNRAQVVLAGGFKIQEALKTLEKFYGKFEKQPWIEPKIDPEQFHSTLRRKTIQMKTESVLMADAVAGLSYHDSAVASENLLCFLWSDSTRGYLNFELVEKGLARSVSADCSPNLDPGLSTLFVVGNPGVSQSKLEQAYLKANQGFLKWLTPDRVEKAKLYFIAGQWGSLRDPMNLAEDLASSATTTGDPLYSFSQLEKIQKISLADIQKRWSDRKKSGLTRVFVVPGSETPSLEKTAPKVK